MASVRLGVDDMVNGIHTTVSVRGSGSTCRCCFLAAFTALAALRASASAFSAPACAARVNMEERQQYNQITNGVGLPSR